MAHIIYNRQPGDPAAQLIINGVDISNEVFHGPELVEVGEGEFAEVGFRVTFAVSRLDLDNESDVKVTDHLRSVAQRVRSVAEAGA